jgi:seryl-tRNA synthetase
MMENKMNDKTINNIPVSEDTFNKMIFLQERNRRIVAEAALLQREKAETETAIAALMAEIEKNAPLKETNGLAQQVAAAAPGVQQTPTPTA